ncbi:RpnC/YadD family protein [Bacillus chungangensis]|uniref:Transposase/invertase (TIGR01784 family) n=1 Tax=Bacillus chungangensis TaxID=587633 RepID=A0ABT9WNJ7_9BACI|nr:hypothetical protein [Bacillus chungangensis]MDQ0174679.1 putative transposase/invertase (TIGR01784 family) [Bacillus chungangensis]
MFIMLVQEKKKKYVIDYDYLWKTVITELFEDFMYLFAPNLAQKIDWRYEPKALEQELLKLFPKHDKKGTRHMDKLMKVRLRNGKDQWILIHVEIQQSQDDHFGLRMFQYFYRTFDKYEQKIVALALLTDGNRSFHPTAYHYNFHGTRLKYQFNTYKILDQDETKLLQMNNRFAYAILAGKYALQTKKDMDIRYQFKRKLLTLVLQDKHILRQNKRSYLNTLFSFIDYLLYIPLELKEKLQTQLNPLIDKEVSTLMQPMKMKPSPMIKDYIAMKREEGVKKGKVDGIKEVAKRMLQKKMEIENIIECTGLSKEKIMLLQKELED